MKVVGYVRVSTSRQAEEGLGLKVQERAIRAWARGGKEITFIGAVGNRLDYVLVTVPSVRNAEELNVNPSLALEALLVELRRELAGVAVPS